MADGSTSAASNLASLVLDRALTIAAEIDVVAVVHDLVALPSDESEAAVAGYLARRLKQLGVDSERHEIEAERFNLVASHGRGPGSLVFNSHMDTVPTGGEREWSAPPNSAALVDGHLVGRGTADAKGPLAAMTVAFEALVRADPTPPRRLTLMAVGCEETGGRGTLHEVTHGVRAEAAVIGEPTSLSVLIAHKGVLRLEVELLGRAGHAALPETGINAIFGMAPLLLGLERLAADIRRRDHPQVGAASLVVSTIRGGQAVNMIPGSCVIHVDRRLIPGEIPEEAEAEIRRAVEAVTAPDLQVLVRRVRCLDAAQTDEGEPIVAATSRAVQQVLGAAPRVSGLPQTCDMWALRNRAGIPTVIVGPGDLALCHVVDERVPVRELLAAVEIYTRLAVEWLYRDEADV